MKKSTKSVPTEQDAFKLLSDCGFNQQTVKVADLVTVGFDIALRASLVPNFLIQYRQSSFFLLFPYRYPVYMKVDSAAHTSWEMTVEELFTAYTRLSEQVIALGGQQSDAAFYLHCYLACPREEDKDFSDVLDLYTEADILHISQHARHLPADTLTELISHRVPVTSVISYDPGKMHLSLFLEMFPTGFYDHTRV